MQTYKKIQTYTNFQVKKCKKVLKIYKKEGVRPFFGANSYIIPLIKATPSDPIQTRSGALSSLDSVLQSRFS